MLKTATAMAAARPNSPSRCRSAGCRVHRISNQVSSSNRPPPTAVCRSQMPAEVQVRFMDHAPYRARTLPLSHSATLYSATLNSAAASHGPAGIGDHRLHAFQLLGIDCLAAQQAQDELIGGAVEDAIEKPRRALVPAEARRIDKRAAVHMVLDEPLLLLHQPQQGLHSVISEVLIRAAGEMAIDGADARWAVLPEHFEDFHFARGRT